MHCIVTHQNQLVNQMRESQPGPGGHFREIHREHEDRIYAEERPKTWGLSVSDARTGGYREGWKESKCKIWLRYDDDVE